MPRYLVCRAECQVALFPPRAILYVSTYHTSEYRPELELKQPQQHHALIDLDFVSFGVTEAIIYISNSTPSLERRGGGGGVSVLGYSYKATSIYIYHYEPITLATPHRSTLKLQNLGECGVSYNSLTTLPDRASFY